VATFTNLTPHEVVVYDTAGNVVLRVPPSGQVARVSTQSTVIGAINGIPVRKTVYGPITGLPDPIDGTVYIVSTVVLLALKDKGVHRPDVVSPDTNPDSAVRDESGKIMGVRYFQVI